MPVFDHSQLILTSHSKILRLVKDFKLIIQKGDIFPLKVIFFSKSMFGVVLFRIPVFNHVELQPVWK